MIRKAASLILESPSKRVLMMKRPPIGSYPSLHVFPGGMLDETDANLLHCALRETFEETGLLVNPRCGETKVYDGSAEDYETAVEEQFDIVMDKFDWSEATDKLKKASSWITPPNFTARRYDVQFYILRVVDEPDLNHCRSVNEAEYLEWILPNKALEQYDQGQISLYPPQFYLLSVLAHHGSDFVAKCLTNRLVASPEMVKNPAGAEVDWGMGSKATFLFNELGQLISMSLKSIEPNPLTL